MPTQVELKRRWEARRASREFNDELAATLGGLEQVARAITHALPKRRPPTDLDLRFQSMKHQRTLAQLRHERNRIR